MAAISVAICTAAITHTRTHSHTHTRTHAHTHTLTDIYIYIYKSHLGSVNVLVHVASRAVTIPDVHDTDTITIP